MTLTIHLVGALPSGTLPTRVLCLLGDLLAYNILGLRAPNGLVCSGAILKYLWKGLLAWTRTLALPVLLIRSH